MITSNSQHDCKLDYVEVITVEIGYREDNIYI